MNFADKIVVITGGAKGIGAATAKLFYDEGGTVVILDIEHKPDLKDERLVYLKCDVSNEAQVREAFENITKRFSTVDFLINNAGIQRYGSVTETSTHVWDHVMNVNLKSFFLCSKYAIPLMQKRQKGVVINVASVQAFLSQQNVAAYTTAKSAILGLTRSIAVDYAPH